jgi:tetratricopeptide (TPR) repeat protein
LGQLYEARGRSEEAEPAYREAVDMLEGLVTQEPSAGPLLALAYNSLAVLQLKTGHGQQVEPLYRKALELGEAIRRTDPHDTANQNQLARTNYNLGLFLQQVGRSVESEAALRQAVDYWTPLARDQRGSRQFQDALANAYSVLGVSHQKDAEQFLKKALALFEELARRHPERYQDEVARGQHNLADLYLGRGRPADAEPLLTAAVAIRDQLVKANLENAYYQAQLSGDLQLLGRVFASTGRRESAVTAYERAVSIMESAHRKYPKETTYTYLLATAHGNYGQLLKDGKRHQEALKQANQAVELLAALVKAEPQNRYWKTILAAAYRLRAQVLVELGRPIEALADLGRMQELAK